MSGVFTPFSKSLSGAPASCLSEDKYLRKYKQVHAVYLIPVVTAGWLARVARHLISCGITFTDDQHILINSSRLLILRHMPMCILFPSPNFSHLQSEIDWHCLHETQRCLMVQILNSSHCDTTPICLSPSPLCSSHSKGMKVEEFIVE